MEQMCYNLACLDGMVKGRSLLYNSITPSTPVLSRQQNGLGLVEFAFGANMNELTEVQKAYIAGFFDGEGCISISKYQGKNNITPAYTLKVVIGQKGDQPLFEFMEITGLGKIHKHKKQSCSGDFYQWHLCPADAKELLMAMLPYLRNKKREAQIAVEFVQKFNRASQTRGEGKGRGYSIPKCIVEQKERYRLALHELKGSSGEGRGAPRKATN
jgi:hypothetical protein